MTVALVVVRRHPRPTGCSPSTRLSGVFKDKFMPGVAAVTPENTIKPEAPSIHVRALVAPPHTEE